MHRVVVSMALAVSAFGAPKLPPIRPEVQGVFPHGGQRGTDVELHIRGKNLQGATAILFATPKLSATILSVEHNAVKARFHIDPSAEPGRHDFRLVAPHGSTINWFDVSSRKGSQFDSVIDLLDSAGTLLDYSDDYYMFKDPHLVYTFTKAGTYFLRIYGSGEAGSDNADYRLTAGEMPQVDHAMPSGGRLGETVEFELAGVNLASVSRVTLGDGIATGEVVSKTPRSAKVRMRIPATVSPGAYRLHVQSSDQ